MNGNDSDYQKKATAGITAQYRRKDAIDVCDYDLDVGFTYPRGEGASKGSAVRRLKSDMS